MSLLFGNSTTCLTGLLETLRYRWRLPIVITLMLFALLGDLSAIAADLSQHFANNRQEQEELSTITSDQEIATIPFSNSEFREFRERTDSPSFAKLHIAPSCFKISNLNANDFVNKRQITSTTPSHNTLQFLFISVPRPPPLNS